MKEVANSYIRTSNKEDIFDIIKRSNAKGECLVWQNVGDEKKAYSIEKIEINHEINTLFLYLKNYQEFDTARPIYIKLSHRQTIFKAKYLADFEEVLSVEIPRELMTKENRKEVRHKFKLKDKMTLTLSYEVNLIKSSWQNIDFNLLDIASGGFSLLCNEKMATLLSSVKVFYVEVINFKKLDAPLSARFVYSHNGKFKIYGKVVNQNRVGFKFDKKLTQKQLESFLTSLKVK